MPFIISLFIIFQQFLPAEIRTQLTASKWRVYKTIEVTKNNLAHL